MIKITFIQADGAEQIVQAVAGQSVMHAAKVAGVSGILAECGGACACATCHVYVAPDWLELAGRPGAMEAEMLECSEAVQETSRLSCQIRVSEELHGLVVNVPAEQQLA